MPYESLASQPSVDRTGLSRAWLKPYLDRDVSRPEFDHGPETTAAYCCCALNQRIAAMVSPTTAMITTAAAILAPRGITPNTCVSLVEWLHSPADTRSDSRVR